MRTTWKLFADLAEAAGDRTVTVDVAEDATVDDALDALLETRPALSDRVLDDGGGLRNHLNVLRNGETVSHEELSVAIDDGDELALFPPVTGG